MNTVTTLGFGLGIFLLVLSPPGLGSSTTPTTHVEDCVASHGVDAGPAEDCGVRILAHSPSIEERGIAHDAAEVTIRFDRELDPASVSEETIQLGWIDRRGGFNPVRADRRLSDQGLVISLRPAEPLWPAVYYHVRLKGDSPEGVRSRTGLALMADYEWRFATGVWLEGPERPSRRLYSCDLPPTTVPATGPFAGNVVVNVYQSVCNPDLLPDKNTLVRVYAPWYQNEDVAVADQLPFFDATVSFSADGRPLGEVDHRFFRPDTEEYGDLAEFGENTANLFTTFSEGEQPVAIDAEVKPTDATTRFSPGRAPLEWRQWRRGRERVRYHVYTFRYLGTGPTIGEPPSDMVRMTNGLVELTEQAFPVKSASWLTKGVLSIGTASAPSRKLNAVPGQNFPHWDWLDSTGAVTKSGQHATQEIADRLARAAGSRLVKSETDVVVGVVPASFLTDSAGANALAATVPVADGEVILTPADGPHFVLHEAGHKFGLLHCPFTGGDTYEFGDVRSNACDVEGFRIDPDGTDGWNKSRTEGNTESQWLSALMYYSAGRRYEFRDVDVPGVANTSVEDVWPSMDSYRSLMVWWSSRPDLLRTPDRVPAPLSPGQGGPSHTVVDVPVDGGAHGHAPTAEPGAPMLQESPTIIRGFADPDGSDAWITSVDVGPGTPASDSDSASDLETVSGLRVIVRGRDGSVVGEHTVRVPPFDPAHSRWRVEDPRNFRVVVPASADVGSIEVVGDGGVVLAERTRSAGPPVVRLIAPEPGDELDAGDRIRWEGSDPDGDPLTYEVQARAGAEGPWIGLGSTRETSMVLEGWEVPAGPNVDVRVIARDGFDRAEDSVNSIEVRRPPLAVALVSDSGAGEPVDRPLTVVFDVPVDAARLESAFELEGPEGNRVPLTVSLSEEGTAASLRPAEALRPGAAYSIHLDSDLTDVHGNELDRDYLWSFRTRPDEVPPMVWESRPAPGALTVDRFGPIRVDMSEDLDPASVNSSTVRVERGGSPIRGEVRWIREVGSILFIPSDPLDLNTRVRVTVDGVRDLAGNVLRTPYVFAFTTEGRLAPLAMRMEQL